jgi:hypothetical protein
VVRQIANVARGATQDAEAIVLPLAKHEDVLGDTKVRLEVAVVAWDEQRLYLVQEHGDAESCLPELLQQSLEVIGAPNRFRQPIVSKSSKMSSAGLTGRPVS